MIRCKNLLILICVAFSIMVMTGIVSSSPDPCHATLTQRFVTDQTSAGLYMNELRRQDCPRPTDESEHTTQHHHKFLLMADLYVKAHSYAWMNKVFFLLAAISGFGVLIWPALGIVFKQAIGDREWHKSATVQTTLSAVTALMIAFYSEYKLKQTSIENLMRAVMYAPEAEIDTLSAKIIDELGKIDNGFSFNSFTTHNKNQTEDH